MQASFENKIEQQFNDLRKYIDNTISKIEHRVSKIFFNHILKLLSIWAYDLKWKITSFHI